MAGILDYVAWRGDLSFSQDAFNAVDAVVFCALSYVRYTGRAASAPDVPIPLPEAAAEFLAQEDAAEHVRTKTDLDLLRLAAASRRFGGSLLCSYRNLFIPEQETQFAAMTFLLDDGTQALVFRGTDGTLVGWKEDFNMAFQQSVPAQRLALEYVREAALARSEPMRLVGHSKGGNLAVFAAARSSPMIQGRILDVYNNDGPGFTEYMMGDPGYLAVVDKIHTFVPQSSVIGMLLEHEEPYTVVHSKSVSVWQHDLYSWELMGNRLITLDSVTKDSVFVDATIKNWLASMTNQERNQFVDAVYSLVSAGGADRPGEILQPRRMKAYLKVISADEQLRRLLSTEFLGLVDAARKAYVETERAKAAALPQGGEVLLNPEPIEEQ